MLVEIDSKSNIIKTEFTKSLIKSNERMSYEEAQFVLKNNKEKLPPEVTITGKSKKVSNISLTQKYVRYSITHTVKLLLILTSFDKASLNSSSHQKWMMTSFSLK